MQIEDFIEVYVVGEMNIYKALENKKVFLSYLKNGKNVILDLSNVTEFDTTGLQLLMSFKKSLKGIEKNLYLRNPSSVIKNVFSLLGVEKYFEMVN